MSRYGYLKVFQKVPQTEVTRVNCFSAFPYFINSAPISFTVPGKKKTNNFCPEEFHVQYFPLVLGQKGQDKQ